MKHSVVGVSLLCRWFGHHWVPVTQISYPENRSVLMTPWELIHVKCCTRCPAEIPDKDMQRAQAILRLWAS